MADRKLKKTLAEAQKAYRKKEKRKGAQLIDQVLQEDFNNPGAWELLHQIYGPEQKLEDFRRSFTNQYYPDRLSELQEIGQQTPAVSEKKPSFFVRLFGRKRAPSPEENVESTPASTPQVAPPSNSAPPGAGEQPAADHPPSRLPHTPPFSIPARRTAPPSVSQSGSTRAPAAPVAPGSAYPARPLSAADSTKIRILVVDDIAQTRENIIRSLRFQENFEVIGTATNGTKAIQLTKELDPDVVVMDVNMPDMDGITATAGIRRQVSHTQIVILTVQDDVDYIRKAMLAGARDFLTKPPMIDELADAVQRAGDLAHQERAKAPPVAVEAPIIQTPSRGKIITVYSPRGGTGCTTLAVNLAAALQTENSQVVIVDGNLQFGDVAIFFNVQNKNSVTDLALRVDELDPELVEGVLDQHSSGVKLLAAPRPELVETVTSPQFNKLLNYLAELYAYVIVDTAHRFNDVTLAALEANDLTVLVVSQEIPSLGRARKFFDLVTLLQFDPQRIFLVLNPYDKRINITPEKIGQSFNKSVGAVLPLERDVVVNSINRGVPFMTQKDLASRPIVMAFAEMRDAVVQRIEQLANP